MSEEWNEESAIEKITKLEKWKERFERSMRFQQPDLSLMTAEEVAEYKADLDAGRRKDLINDLVSLAYDVLVRVGCSSGGIVLPVPILAEHKELSKTIDASQLQTQEELREVKISLIDDGTKIYERDCKLNEPTPDYESGKYPVTFHIGPAWNKRIEVAKNPQQYNEIVRDARESLVILSEYKKFQTAVLQVYQKEIENRKNQSTIPDLMEKAKSVAKEAEKVIKNIANSNEKFVKSRLSGAGDVESAHAFMENLDKYHNLSAQFRNICHELTYFGETRFPHFPDLTTDITKSKGEIEHVVAREMGQKASQNYQREIRLLHKRDGQNAPAS